MALLLNWFGNFNYITPKNGKNPNRFFQNGPKMKIQVYTFRHFRPQILNSQIKSAFLTGKLSFFKCEYANSQIRSLQTTNNEGRLYLLGFFTAFVNFYHNSWSIHLFWPPFRPLVWRPLKDTLLDNR